MPISPTPTSATSLEDYRLSSFRAISGACGCGMRSAIGRSPPSVNAETDESWGVYSGGIPANWSITGVTPLAWTTSSSKPVYPPAGEPVMRHFDHRFRAMGRPCWLRFDCADEAAAARAIAAAEARSGGWPRYSRYLPDSLTSTISRAAGGHQPVPIDTETARAAGLCRYALAAKPGPVRLTAGVLRRVWDFRSPADAQAAIDARYCPLIGWQRVQWDPVSIRLPEHGMKLISAVA